jgi:hypothetical protein
MIATTREPIEWKSNPVSVLLYETHMGSIWCCKMGDYTYGRSYVVVSVGRGRWG